MGNKPVTCGCNENIAQYRCYDYIPITQCGELINKIKSKDKIFFNRKEDRWEIITYLCKECMSKHDNRQRFCYRKRGWIQ